MKDFGLEDGDVFELVRFLEAKEATVVFDDDRGLVSSG
jgi:hypothetical protein